jgi:hypothetical protein
MTTLTTTGTATTHITSTAPLPDGADSSLAHHSFYHPVVVVVVVVVAVAVAVVVVVVVA